MRRVFTTLLLGLLMFFTGPDGLYGQNSYQEDEVPISGFVSYSTGHWVGAEIPERQQEIYGNHAQNHKAMVGLQFEKEKAFSAVAGSFGIGYEVTGVPLRENSVMFQVSGEYRYDIIYDMMSIFARARLIMSTKNFSAAYFDLGLQTEFNKHIDLQVYASYVPAESVSAPQKYQPNLILGIGLTLNINRDGFH